MADKNVKIAQVMTPEVVTLFRDSPMKDAADIFERSNLHHIPVICKKKKVKGILSKVEYHKLLHGFTFMKAKIATKFNKEIFASVTVGEVMTKPVATLYPDDTIEQALGYFRENMFRAAPVIDRKSKRIVGIVTVFDLLNYAYSDA